MNTRILLPHGSVAGNQPVRVVLVTISDSKRPGVVVFGPDSEDLRPEWRSKNVSQHEKLEDVKITFGSPVYVDRIEVSQDGRRVDVIGRPNFLVQVPQPLKPAFVELVGYYDRRTKRKVLYRYACSDRYAPANIHWVLSEWSSFFAIDTNTRRIDGQQVSMTSVIEGHSYVILDTGPGFKFRFLYTDGKIGVSGNPERAALLELVDKIQAERGAVDEQRFGIITDSEAGFIDAYNARTEPVYAGRMLPPQFHVMFASDAAGRDAYVPNKMIARCDRTSTAALSTARVSPRK